MRMKHIDFEEHLCPFNMATRNTHFREFSPTGKVPCLIDGETKIWESLAILEYLADIYPQKNMWPTSRQPRAFARSISCEMLGGFMHLRNECPMNMNRKIETLDISNPARADVKRIENIWDECLQKSGGPFLFGDFTNADAMYAPIVNRLQIYKLSNNQSVKQYSAAMMETKPWQQWQEAGRAEPWIVTEDEA